MSGTRYQWLQRMSRIESAVKRHCKVKEANHVTPQMINELMFTRWWRLGLRRQIKKRLAERATNGTFTDVPYWACTIESNQNSVAPTAAVSTVVKSRAQESFPQVPSNNNNHHRFTNNLGRSTDNPGKFTNIQSKPAERINRRVTPKMLRGPKKEPQSVAIITHAENEWDTGPKTGLFACGMNYTRRRTPLRRTMQSGKQHAKL